MSAGSCATSSRWAPARSRCWTGFASTRVIRASIAGRRDRRLRELGRRADGRRRGGVRRRVHRQRARECDVRGAAAGRPDRDGRRERPRQPRRRVRRHHGARRNRRRVGARERRARGGRRRQAAERPGRRSLHGKEADRGVGRARGGRPRRVAPGLRRRRARVLAFRDGSRDGDRPRARPGAAPRRGDGAVGGHDLREPGADGRGYPAADARCGRSALRALGAAPRRDRGGHRFGSPAGSLGGRGRGRDSGALPHRRVPALPDRARTAAAPEAPSQRAGRARTDGGAARAARLAERPQPRADLPQLRPSRRLAHGAPSGVGCSRAAPAARVSRARGLARRPGPADEPRSTHRRRARRARGRAERRVRRWRAARPHGLPQLRQPREARDRVGADGGDRGNGTRVRGAARADRVRQRLALQRDGRACDPSDAGRRLRRARPRRPRRAGGVAGRRRDPAGERVAGLARRIRVSGALRRGRRQAAAARAHCRGGARRVPLAGGAVVLARARRL